MTRMFGSLKKHPKGRLIIDVNPTPPICVVAQFSDGHSWTEFYKDCEESMPYDMPLSDGHEATLTCFVDADHACDKVSCCSVTGLILLLNNTLIYWVSQRQKTVETSTYGSEMVAIIKFCYKLRMLGVPVESKSILVGDNLVSVVINTTLPSSQLKKKHQACNYHRVRKAIAAGFICFGHIDTVHQNIADVCTKPLPGPLFHKQVAVTVLISEAQFPSAGFRTIGLMLHIKGTGKNP